MSYGGRRLLGICVSLLKRQRELARMSKASGTRSTITVVLQGDSSSAISPQGAAAERHGAAFLPEPLGAGSAQEWICRPPGGKARPHRPEGITPCWGVSTAGAVRVATSEQGEISCDSHSPAQQQCGTIGRAVAVCLHKVGTTEEKTVSQSLGLSRLNPVEMAENELINSPSH